MAIALSELPTFAAKPIAVLFVPPSATKESAPTAVAPVVSVAVTPTSPPALALSPRAVVFAPFASESGPHAKASEPTDSASPFPENNPCVCDLVPPPPVLVWKLTSVLHSSAAAMVGAPHHKAAPNAIARAIVMDVTVSLNILQLKGRSTTCVRIGHPPTKN